jgi:hypothetical protein
MEYLKSPEQKIIDLLKATLTYYPFKEYFDGEPVLIPESLLPCIVVHKVNGTEGFGPTGFDKSTSEIVIKVVFNKKDDLSSSGRQYTTHKKLKEIIEARDGTTKLFVEKSIMGILRKNVTLVDTVIDQEIDLNYDVVPRPDDVITEEGHVTIRVTQLIQINNRS